MAESQGDYKAPKVSDAEKFPINLLADYKSVSIDAASCGGKLTDEQRSALKSNIQLFRDTIVFFTATASARGCGGHTGGPFDVCPEVAILLALFNSDKDESSYVHTMFDEAGHRVAIQYMLSALKGAFPLEHLMHHREAHSCLPGHPELGLTPGVQFSSGRLGHMWPMVNGVSLANRSKTVFCLASDGSQQEGNDAEAARLAVAQGLNVKLLVDDNDVTIAGHPSEYLKGTSVAKTLEGHGLHVIHADGEDIDDLFSAIIQAIKFEGPVAVVSKRKMMPGVEGLEGTTHAHDCIPVDKAIKYLTFRGYDDNVTRILTNIKPAPSAYLYTGVSKDKDACRSTFGTAVCNVLDKMSPGEAKEKVCVIDSDLEGSTGIAAIHKKHPECFISSGIMERGNLAAAAGFGFDNTKFGVFSTFSAFLEMTISEITMARLNFSNLLCHFSHSGVDEMADNTCHFGLNHYFADNGLLDAHTTMLYFPADCAQMHAIVNKVFFEKGLRFIFSTRSKVPYLLKEGTQERLFEGDYQFTGKDEVIRQGDDATIVTYGDSVYRCLDAVERLRVEGINVTLINKPVLNVVDEEAIQIWGKSKVVLVVETINQKTGMGSKAGTWLLERGLTPKYGYMGANREGCGGLHEQVFHQGLDSQSIMVKLKSMI